MILEVLNGGAVWWLEERREEVVVGLCSDGSIVELTDLYDEFICEDVYDDDGEWFDEECITRWYVTVNGTEIEELVEFWNRSKLVDSNREIIYFFEVNQEEYLSADEETRKRAISLNA